MYGRHTKSSSECWWRELGTAQPSTQPKYGEFPGRHVLGAYLQGLRTLSEPRHARQLRMLRSIW